MTCEIYKEITQMNLFTKQTHRLREITKGCQSEGFVGEIERAFGMDVYTLLYLKCIANKGTLLNVMYSLDRRGVWGRMDTCICMVESLCCPLETITTLLIS